MVYGKDLPHKRFFVPARMADMRLDHVVSLFLDISRKDAKALVESGMVLCKGMKATFGSRKVSLGDEIVIFIDSQKKDAGMRKAEAIPILMEDGDILVVDKPAGYLTCRSASERGLSVSDVLKKTGKTVFPAHRLDRETSGVLVFAKTVQALKDLERQFKQRSVTKVYIGIVEGDIKRSDGVIRGDLVKTHEFGQTSFRVIKKLSRASIVEFMPHTGRTNQIRLQLLAMGCCLVGEKKYIPGRLRSSIVFPRAALHARQIWFTHPRTGQWVTCEAPMPEDMKQLVETL
ncbi:MAG TPA: RluA family pseudouridine synthase [bacterium]